MGKCNGDVVTVTPIICTRTHSHKIHTGTNKSKATSIFNYTQTIITTTRHTNSTALLLLLTNTYTQTSIQLLCVYGCVRLHLCMCDRKLTTQQIFCRFWCRRHFVFLCVCYCTLRSYSSLNSFVSLFFVLNTSSKDNSFVVIAAYK